MIATNGYYSYTNQKSDFLKKSYLLNSFKTNIHETISDHPRRTTPMTSPPITQGLESKGWRVLDIN